MPRGQVGDRAGKRRVLAAGETGVLDAGRTSVEAGERPDPDAATRHEKTEQQTAEDQHGKQQGEQRGRVVVDVDAHIALNSGELDRTQTTGKLGGLTLRELEARNIRVEAGDLGELVLVERICVHGDALVEAEVAREDGELQLGGVTQIGRDRATAGGGRHGRRAEEALERDLLRQAVRHLDHAVAVEVGVLREERDGTGEHHSAARIFHRDDRCVPVAQQVNLRATDLQGRVHLEHLLGPAARRGARRDLGVERLGLPGAALEGVGGRELVEPQLERFERVLVCEAARAERVVVGERVGERFPRHEDALAGVAEAAEDADREQHPDERDVEDQVAGLAQIAALGRDAQARPPPVRTAASRVVAGNAVALPLQ